MAQLPRDVVILAPEQFDKLVELLTPGYELAKAYLEQSQPVDAKPEEGSDHAAFRPSAPASEFEDDKGDGSDKQDAD